jgi:hypothetical protein
MTSHSSQPASKEALNIVSLIEKDISIRLNHSYQSTLLNKIQDGFSSEEQQIFVASFYCYLKYDPKKDFVIDFTNVWKWCGFARKDHAKRLLEKNFVEGVDYKVEKAAPPMGGAGLDKEKAAPPIGGAKCLNDEKAAPPIGGAGLNKEKITLTVNVFKKFCIKAGTKKADEIHDYYIKLEELLQETLKEQSDELQKQLSIQQQLNEEQEKALEVSKKEVEILTKRYLKKKVTVDGVNVVYLTTSDYGKKDRVYAVGKSKTLKTRIQHYNGNKIHEFNTVYFKSFKSLQIMNVAEKCILLKLYKYKNDANHDTFKLPEDKEISLFTKIFDETVNFFENVSIDAILKPETEEEKKEYKKDWREENKEELQEYFKEYREKNKEEISEKAKTYREKYKERVKLRKAKFYKKNRDKIAIQQKIFYQAYKAKILAKNKDYSVKNKEKLRMSNKVYREKNKEKLVAYRKKYYQKNIVEFKKKLAKYRTEHKDARVIYDKQYREKNKESIALYKKKHYQKNKHIIAKKQSEYYEEHKDERHNYNTSYYNDNKEKLNTNVKKYNDEHKEELIIKRKETSTCECGMEVTRINLQRHLLSKNHLKKMNITTEYKTTCVCGAEVGKAGIYKHLNTDKHKNRMLTLVPTT